MKPQMGLLKTVSFCLLIGSSLPANDGWDRYRKAVPSTFRLFPAPASPQAGYMMLDKDAEGGADGNICYRWAQPHAIALVRIALRAVAKDLGTGPYPAAIMDASSENGDTPVDFHPVQRGRHPGGSHDGGLNLDIGYYLTSLQGKRFSPDYAAGTEHFEQQPSGEWKDVCHCIGAADRLDVARTARFYVELFKINETHFNRDLLEEIGTDFYVRESVINQVKAWAKTGQYGASPTMAADMARVLTCDEADGWYNCHHHHLHLRLRDLPLLGTHRASLEGLQARARQEEAELLASQSTPVLTAALLSTDLERSIEAELLPSPLGVETVRFRFNGGKWQRAQPGDPRNRTVLELSDNAENEGQALVEAEGKLTTGKPFSVSTTVPLPPQDKRLAVAVEPSRVNAEVKEGPQSLSIRSLMPPAFQAWVTETALLLYRDGKPMEKRAIALTGEQTVDKTGLTKVVLQVVCSGRRTVKVPIWLK